MGYELRIVGGLWVASPRVYNLWIMSDGLRGL